jgi:protein-S-isoprenylcysteine O-methyltransferase Ste14
VDVVPFRIWPPVALGVPLGVGVAVTLWWGDPASLPAARRPVGWLLLLGFACWNGWSLLLLRRHRTGLLPGQPTTVLVERGPFAWSRNPLYVGLVVLDVGIGLLVPSVWALCLVPMGVAALEWGAVRPEERYLRARFGPAYDDYAGRVRRWL